MLIPWVFRCFSNRSRRPKDLKTSATMSNTKQHCTALRCVALRCTALHYTAINAAALLKSFSEPKRTIPPLDKNRILYTLCQRNCQHCTARYCSALHRTAPSTLGAGVGVLTRVHSHVSLQVFLPCKLLRAVHAWKHTSHNELGNPRRDHRLLTSFSMETWPS